MKTDDTKRPKMKGGIRKRGPAGRWSFTIDLGLQPAQRCDTCRKRFWVTRKVKTACPICGGPLRSTAERRQESSGHFETRTAAVQARAKAVVALGSGTHVRRDNITLGAWLTDEWLPSLSNGKLRATTLQSYRSHVEHHIAPTKLGAMPLQTVSREAIAKHYAQLRVDGRADGSKKVLTASTIRRIHATLHRALRDAVRSHLLPLNPAADIEMPADEERDEHKDGRKFMAWDSSQLRHFLTGVKDDRLSALWLLYATTGARRGELLGLTWPDIELDETRLTIRRTHVEVGGQTVESRPKTDSGARTIALDEVTVAVLKRHRKAQTADRLAAGPRWQDSGHVFVDDVGQPLPPGRVSRAFTAAVVAAREQITDEKTRDIIMPVISLHGLRHTFATIALVERRLPASMVSKRLGHKNEMITLTMYAEVLPRHDEEAAADVAGVVIPAGF
jgi:integrase